MNTGLILKVDRVLVGRKELEAPAFKMPKFDSWCFYKDRGYFEAEIPPYKFIAKAVRCADKATDVYSYEIEELKIYLKREKRENEKE